MVIFYSYVNVYQRVYLNIWFYGSLNQLLHLMISRLDPMFDPPGDFPWQAVATRSGSLPGGDLLDVTATAPGQLVPGRGPVEMGHDIRDRTKKNRGF